jgi:glycosyltransferase involved in cell wall biosynthesis
MISFIVPAYNEELLIADTLAALARATSSLNDSYEVIVVDDGSSDRTAAISAECGARVVRVSHRQISATRNSGARAASGDRLVFVDADTLVNDEILAAAIAAMNEGAIGGGAGMRFDGRVPLFARILQGPMVTVFRWARLAAGCFIFCTREGFEECGGFSEEMYGAEEIAISRSLKRLGRFVILREQVTTSGRKLRAYSGLEILKVFGHFLLRGPGAVRTRDGMELWYGERRNDPDSPAPGLCPK